MILIRILPSVMPTRRLRTISVRISVHIMLWTTMMRPEKSVASAQLRVLQMSRVGLVDRRGLSTDIL